MSAPLASSWFWYGRARIGRTCLVSAETHGFMSNLVCAVCACVCDLLDCRAFPRIHFLESCQYMSELHVRASLFLPVSLSDKLQLRIARESKTKILLSRPFAKLCMKRNDASDFLIRQIRFSPFLPSRATRTRHHHVMSSRMLGHLHQIAQPKIAL